MKTKYFLINFTILLFLHYFVGISKAQDEMDFEEFMGMMSETLTEKQLDELSYLLPWDIKVLAYAYGDFSGDYKDDIVLSIKEIDVTPKKTLDVYFFKNIGDSTYKFIEKKNVKWLELSLEIAFLVKNGLCYVTSRDNTNWYFTGYKIISNELTQVKRETFPIGVGKAGN